MRYIKQPSGSVLCGPVAIVNAAKWGGGGLKVSDLPNIADKCQVRPGHGTSRRNFERVLRQHCLVTARSPHCRKDRLDDWLLAGGAAVLSYDTPSGGGHYTLILKLEFRCYLFANDCDARDRLVPTVWVCQRHFLERYWQERHRQRLVWFLEKQE